MTESKDSFKVNDKKDDKSSSSVNEGDFVDGEYSRVSNYIDRYYPSLTAATKFQISM